MFSEGYFQYPNVGGTGDGNEGMEWLDGNGLGWEWLGNGMTFLMHEYPGDWLFVTCCNNVRMVLPKMG